MTIVVTTEALSTYAPVMADRVHGVECGVPMTVVRRGTNVDWYRCGGSCGRHMIPARDLDREVCRELFRRRPALRADIRDRLSLVMAMREHVTGVRVTITRAVTVHLRSIEGDQR